MTNMKNSLLPGFRRSEGRPDLRGGSPRSPFGYIKLPDERHEGICGESLRARRVVRRAVAPFYENALRGGEKEPALGMRVFSGSLFLYDFLHFIAIGSRTIFGFLQQEGPAAQRTDDDEAPS